MLLLMEVSTLGLGIETLRVLNGGVVYVLYQRHSVV